MNYLPGFKDSIVNAGTLKVLVNWSGLYASGLFNSKHISKKAYSIIIKKTYMNMMSLGPFLFPISFYN